MRLAAALLALALLAVPAARADVPGAADHPAVARYPGAEILWQDVSNWSEFRIATGPVTGYRRIDEWIDAAGRLTRTFYELTGERSHEEVWRNYRDALAAGGFEIVAAGVFPESSQANDVGSRKWLQVQFAANPLPTGEGIDLLSGSASAGGSGFVAAKAERAAGTAYAAVTVTQQRADRVLMLVEVLEEEAAETGLVAVDAEAIGREIAEYGRVVLTGLEFDHDKATLTPGSDPVLAEIAAFLADHPGTPFFVVGHTDATGAFAYNMDLSRARAREVVRRLVEDHGVDPARLEGHGVGPLAPVVTNAAEAGRARNRRVELVER